MAVSTAKSRVAGIRRLKSCGEAGQFRLALLPATPMRCVGLCRSGARRGGVRTARAAKVDDWSLTVERTQFINHLALMRRSPSSRSRRSALCQRSWRFASIGDVMGVAAAVAMAGAGSFVLGGSLVTRRRACRGPHSHDAALMLSPWARSSVSHPGLLAAAQQAGCARRLVYGAGVEGLNAVRELEGHWTPLERAPNPFGPFVNRNHYAGWMATTPRSGEPHSTTTAERSSDENSRNHTSPTSHISSLRTPGP